MCVDKVGKGALFSAKVLVRTIVVLAACFVAFGIVATILIPGWEVKATTTSPDNKTDASVLVTFDDGVGLAPYGDHVVLTRGRQPKRKDLYEPTFAGYCVNGADITWVDDKKIRIKCATTSQGVVRQDKRWQDIEVVYEISNAPAT